MSDEKQKATRRYVGKVVNKTGNYGPYQKVYIDNLEATNKDGTPNTYYKGALIWADAETGKNYHVKQFSIYIPREGMPADLVQRGFSCYITLNLDDDYEVTVLG